MYAQQVLGTQLNRRQRVLDVVGDLPGHVGPGGQAVGAFQFRPLTLEVGHHAVEGLDQLPQFIRRRDEHPHVELALRDAAGRAGQAANRVGHAFGGSIAE